MCADDGGTIDDLIVYRLAAEHYMLCVNASNIEADWDWLSGLNRDGARAHESERGNRAGRDSGAARGGDPRDA